MRIPKARKVSFIYSSALIHYGVLAVSGAGQDQHGLIFTATPGNSFAQNPTTIRRQAETLLRV